jgi:hypothetical protein
MYLKSYDFICNLQSKSQVELKTQH